MAFDAMYILRKFLAWVIVDAKVDVSRPKYSLIRLHSSEPAHIACIELHGLEIRTHENLVTQIFEHPNVVMNRLREASCFVYKIGD